MLDPVTTPLLLLVLGKLADEIIGGACKDFLKDKLKGLFSKAAKLGSKDDLQLDYESAMQQSYETCREVLLRNIETFGGRRSELSEHRESLEAFIIDRQVAAELFRSIDHPNDQTAPSHEILQARRHAIKGRELPDDQLWLVTAAAYRSQAKKQSFLSEPLREILAARNLDEIRQLIKRQGAVKVQVRRDKYSQRMRTKFSPVDLANLMPAYGDDPGRMVIRDVFVPQNVRENPPPVEIPKDLAERFARGGRHEPGDEQAQQITIEELFELVDQLCRNDNRCEDLRLIRRQIDKQFLGRTVEHPSAQHEFELPLTHACWNNTVERARLDELLIAVYCQ
ncbi:MAG: hypothetical protein IIA11_09045 [Proteobacteria bacterium]|nr:hypothetical protein [Pseudomonadota bacterium]